MPVGIRHLFSLGLVSLCALVGGLVFASTPALAAVEAPKVEEQFVSDIASSSATFNAQVNPGGEETTYTFEYAPAGGSFKPVPEAEGSGNLPAVTAGVALSVHVQGLLSNTSYEFRLMASNSVERVTGEPVSFATQLGGGEFVLPDGRQYEMVTPPEKEGALFKGLVNFWEAVGTIQASVEGNAIAEEASQPTEAEPQGYANEVSVFSSRGLAGWSSHVIAPPRDVVSTYTPGKSEYLLFSENLSRGLVEQFGPLEALSPEASESTPYLRTVYTDGNVDEQCDAPALSASSCFRPLVTRADDTASPFEPFEETGVEFEEPRCPTIYCGPRVQGATPDLSHVIISSKVQLTSTQLTGREGLYEWFENGLRPVSVFPEGEEASGRVWLGGINNDVDENAGEGPGVQRAVSEDGERVIFVSEGLYLRDVGRGETVRLDVPEQGCAGCTASTEPRYMTASADGSRVFFVDEGRLTTDAGESDLYECQMVEVGGKLACDLSDLTPERSGESAGVIQVLGASNDGSYVYFAAAGALTANATPAPVSECKKEASQQLGCNIYVYHDGVTSPVAAGWIADPNAHWSRVSPDGRWLAFMSARGLAGYDTRDAFSGHPDAEVYLYDASTGGLACASCDPTGALPVGVDDDGSGESGEGRPEWVAANVPGRPANFVHINGAFSRASRYQPRYLSDSGRLFFETMDGLVPQDVNGVEDIYEYEPEGVPAGEHACGASSASGSEVYKPARVFEMGGRRGEEGAGCVALISSGTSSEESSFLDASETGRDVFFLTAARLAPQDMDSAPDVYDAHECTNVSPCVAPPVVPPACETEASCRAAPLPQPAIFGAPSSATFSGSGNVAAVPSPSAPVKSAKKPVRCGRGRMKLKGRCVRPRKRARGARAGHEGRSR